MGRFWVVSISEQLINDEKSKWEKHHEIAKKSAEEIQKLKDSYSQSFVGY